MASEVYNLYINIKTPVHVGGAQEKHLVHGLDYVLRNGKVYVFDHQKLMNECGIDQYLNAIEKGANGVNDLIQVRRIDLNRVSQFISDLSGSSNDYKSIIKEGLHGNPYIPGSSIKGAIRSILFNKLWEPDKRIPINKTLDSKLLGVFDNSIMRFIQCSDAYFDNIQVANTKIFNLKKNREDWEGSWKHSFHEGNSVKFQSEGFTTAYEVIPINSAAKFRFSFDRAAFLLYQKKNSRKSIPSNAANLFHEKDFLSEVFRIIHGYSKIFLSQEKEFFKTYSIHETTNILNSINNLENSNIKERPVFRIASGSGFHSITGNWRFESHLKTIDKPDYKNKNKKYKNGMHYKSRRLAFEKQTDGEFLFYPMGFIQLIKEEDYEQNFRPKIQAEKTAQLEAKKREEAEQKKKLEEEKIKAEEARKPVFRSIKQVKKDGVIDAKVIGKKGKQVILEPFVDGFEKERLFVRYAAGFPAGTIVIVKAKIQKRKIVLTGSPKKK
jgi:CRISPR/Cas system CSM-associated protein Csm5 (group 7 of RAMP superfamily)